MTRIGTMLLVVVFVLCGGCKEEAGGGKEEAGGKAKAKDEGEGVEAKDEGKGVEAKDEGKGERPATGTATATKDQDQDDSSGMVVDEKAVALADRAIAAAGGYEALKEKLTAFEIVSQGTFFGNGYMMTTYWQAPDKMVMELHSGGMTMGYVGDQCWNQIHTIVKDCAADERTAAPMSLWSFYVMNLYSMKDEGMKLKYLGEKTIDNRPVEQLRVDREGAPIPITLSFDKETALLVQVEHEGSIAGNRGLLVCDIEEHIDVDGLKMAKRSTLSMDGKVLIDDQYSGVKWELSDESIFTRPPQATFGETAVRMEAWHTVASLLHRGRYERIGMAMGKVFGWLNQNKLMPIGAPLMLYLKDPGSTGNADEYETEIRIPITRPDDSGKLTPGVIVKQVPDYLIAVRVEQGPYAKVSQEYGPLAKWCADNGYEIIGPAGMTTFDNPAVTPPDKLIHELFYEVKKKEVDPFAMEVGTAAKMFFEACAKEDWEMVKRMGPYLFKQEDGKRFKDHFGALTIVELGEPFRAYKYAGWFVRYKVKLKDGSEKHWRIALRNDNKDKEWRADGGL